jgi:hypothetical protein
MRGIGKFFFATALFYGLLGMSLGLHMAITQNHGQLPTHAHIMVIGWVSFAIFGLFYSAYGDSVPKSLSYLHLVLAQLAMIGMAIGLGLIYSGRPQYEPIAAVSATGYAISFLIFAIGAVRSMTSGRS